jgi:hypothetical protein
MMTSGRFVVIVGSAYCGSTFLSRLFASLPGVASVGEAKRLYHVVSSNAPRNEAYCTVCKRPEDCPHFGPKNDEFYDLIAKINDTRRFYGLLLCDWKPGCSVLVTSDKSRDDIWRFIHPGVADLVVLFKRPEAAVLSKLQNDKRFGPQTVEMALQNYCNEYGQDGGALEWVDSWARKSFWVSYEQLAMDPDYEFGMLCRAMDLPQQEGIIDFGNIEWHQIGGNIRSLASRWSLLDEKWRSDLTIAEQREVASNDKVQEVWKRLLVRAIETRLETHRKTKVQADRRRGNHR